MRDWPPAPIPRYRRAVFLDRDGTICVDTHHPHRVEDLSFIPGSLEAIARLASLPLHIIVVSNQAGIALGYYTRAEMSQFNRELRARIEETGGRIDAFYFCPHLEPKHLPPDVPPCGCSKPSPGMLLEAARDFELDLTHTFIIGDKTSDVAAGESVGCITILVKTGKAGKEEGALLVQPKYFAEDLHQAAIIVEACLAREVTIGHDAA